MSKTTVDLTVYYFYHLFFISIVLTYFPKSPPLIPYVFLPNLPSDLYLQSGANNRPQVTMLSLEAFILF